MAAEQIPLLFFTPSPGADPEAVVRSLLDSSPAPAVVPLDPAPILRAIRETRGFARLKFRLPQFSFENPRTQAAFEGTILPTHIRVGFFGDFDKVARPLFAVLTSLGLTCYSIWERNVVAQWPQRDEPVIDKGFAARMQRVMERKTLQLRETVPDEKRRAELLNAFARGAEFRAEMAAEARREKTGGKKTYGDVVNCFARWKAAMPTASELAAVRKLVPKYAATGIAELRATIGNSPRLLLLTAATPQQAARLSESAAPLGLAIDAEAP